MADNSTKIRVVWDARYNSFVMTIDGKEPEFISEATVSALGLTPEQIREADSSLNTRDRLAEMGIPVRPLKWEEIAKITGVSLEEMVAELTSLSTKELPTAVRSTPETPSRGCWIGPPAIDKLDLACNLINRAFGEVCYLVGSATRTRDYRDVDVRMMIPDEKVNLLFGPIRPLEHYALFNLINLSVTIYLREQTGLPIDFQVQSREQANKTYSGEVKHSRHPLGLHSKLSREQLPAWMTIDWPEDVDEDDD